MNTYKFQTIDKYVFKICMCLVYFSLQIADVAYLDEEIVAVHFEIVELQRSPFARTQVDVMEQLSVSCLVCT